METDDSKSDSVVRTFYTVFCGVEMAVHLLGFVVTPVFLTVFCKIRSIHRNLIFVFSSLLISSAISSVFRIAYIVQIHAVTFYKSPASLEVVRLLRIGAAYAVALHLPLLALERLLASRRSMTYENERNYVLLSISILIMWIFSLSAVHLPRIGKVSAIIVAATYLASYITSILVMAYVERTNLELWRRNRGALNFSHAYQETFRKRNLIVSRKVTITSSARMFLTFGFLLAALLGREITNVRENVETSASLFRCFACMSIQTATGWSALMAYDILKARNPNTIAVKILGFVFDITNALAPITIPSLLYIFHKKVHGAFKRKICSAMQPPLADNLVGLDGAQLKVESRKEGDVYFKQFQSAWR